MKIIVRILQVLLAGVFIVSGLTKCIDPAGTALKFTEYLLYFGLDFVVDFSLGMAWVMSILEFIVGINLMIGSARIRTLILATLMMLVFTPLTLWLAVTDAIQDCGCFGDAIRLSNWGTFYKNIAIDLIIVMLWWKRRYLYQMAGRTLRAVYGYWAFGIAVWLCWLGTWSEPWIDFRPFHPGVSIRQAVSQMPDGAVVATYTCVYERDGIRQEFDLDNLPDEAEGWEFVETIEHAADNNASSYADQAQDSNRAISGSAIPIDFYAKSLDGELMTDALLADTSYTFLLLSPALDAASEHDLDKIEALYEYALDHDYHFYGLTSRDVQQVARWQERTGAEYTFFSTDAQIIETITRVNPGIMLLHDGVICWKSRLTKLEELPVASAKLNEQSYGEIRYFDTRNHYFWLFFLLFVPFILPLCVEITKSIKLLTNNKDSKDA